MKKKLGLILLTVFFVSAIFIFTSCSILNNGSDGSNTLFPVLNLIDNRLYTDEQGFVYYDFTQLNSNDDLFSLFASKIPENVEKNDITYIINRRVSSKVPDDLVIPKTCPKGRRVCGIGPSVFSFINNIESITLHEDISIIGSYAFRGCTSLKSIDFGENSRLDTIESGAFLDCTSLTSIALPDSLKYIDGPTSGEIFGESGGVFISGAFSNCTNLHTVSFGQNSSLELIGSVTFYGCTSLKEIYIPKNVKAINIGTFYGCTALGSVDFDNDSVLNRIDMGAFQGCTALTSISIPDSVTHINGFLDYPMRELDSLPDSVLVEGAFADCTNLLTVSFGQNSALSYIGPQAFYNCTFLEGIDIPSGVKTIDISAFARCEGLAYLNFGTNSKLETIKYCAFQGCSSLTELSIPASVVSIEESLTSIDDKYFLNWHYGAFEDCSSLEEITIADGNLRALDLAVFKGCNNIKSITLPGNAKYKNIFTLEKLTALTDINVSAGNSEYVSVDGALYSKDMSKLLIFPLAKFATFYEVPTTVTEIRELAFNGLKNVEHLVTPIVATKEVYEIYDGHYETEYNYIFEGNSSIKILEYTGTDGCDIMPDHVDKDNPLTKLIISGKAGDVFISQLEKLEYVELSGEAKSFYISYCDNIIELNITGKVGEIYLNDIYNPAIIRLLGDIDSIEGASSLDAPIIMSTGVKSIGRKGIIDRETTFYFLGTKEEMYSIEGYGPGKYYVYSELKPTVGGKYWHYVDGVVTIWTDFECQHINLIIYPGSSPTCNYMGVTESVMCKDCGKYLVPRENISATGHNYVNGACTVCGERDKNYTPFYDYTYMDYELLPDEKSYAVIGPGWADIYEYILVPAERDGLPVTVIADDAFCDSKETKTVIISSSITKICRLAFDGCDSITDVYFTGTEQEWNSIIIEFGNECLTNATIHFNYVVEE